MHDWTSTANVLRETERRIRCVPSGMKVGKETWQWNGEVQESRKKKDYFRDNLNEN